MKGGIELFPYQQEGINFLLKNNEALLADQMGLGKTIQAVVAAEKISGRVLICTRATLLHQWREEIQKISNQKIIIIQGALSQREKAWKEAIFSQAKYCICSYDIIKLEKDLQYACNYLNKGILILDEATMVKSHKSQRTKAIWKVRKFASRVYALTGTPFTNHLVEYYQIIKIIKPTIFPNYNEFKKTFLITKKIRVGERDVEIVVGERNLELFRKMVSPIILRRVREDVFTPPVLKIVKHHIKMNSIQLRQEKQLLNEIICTRSSIITIFTHCLQNIISPALINDQVMPQSPLLNEVFETCQSVVENGEQAIVFSTFVSALKIFDTEYLQREGFRSKYIIGEKKHLDSVGCTDHDCLLISTAGGYGLNLQKYYYMIFINEPLNPAVTEQVEGRVNRIGQQHDIQFHKMITENSKIENRVRAILERKKNISEFLLAKEVLQK